MKSEMKADMKRIYEIFAPRGTVKYYVPRYQRPYKWDRDDAEQLAQDIYDSCNSSDEDEYFIGSIICIKKGNRFEVVDGQQRLITLTLIMQALRDTIDDEDIRRELNERLCTFDSFSKDKTIAPVLEVRERERSFYRERIIEGDKKIKAVTDPQKTFVNNQKRIMDFLSDKKDDLKEFGSYLIRKVILVFVEVDDIATSFRLFNVLNNRGMLLSDADLLKNVLLEKVGDDDYKSAEVESRWLEIEEIVGEANLNSFLSIHQVSEKKDRDRVKKKNFDYYENLLKKDFQDDSMKMSKMLLHSARVYGQILEGSIDCAKGREFSIKTIISFLKDLSKPEEWMPAFMAFMRKVDDHEEVYNFIRLFEKVYAQRWLIGLGKSQRDAPCYYAVESINGKNFSCDTLKSILSSLADNDAFENALDENIYDGSRPQIINLVKTVLLRLDREWLDGDVDKSYPGKVTVEHVLPQNMENKYWKTRFSKDDHDEWLHKLGNLTLLGGRKNSAAQNKGFDEKKKDYNSLNKKVSKVSFEITKEICDLPEWNLPTLRDRHEDLKRRIKDLWWVK